MQIHPNDFYKRYIEKVFWIVNTDMESVPFKLNPPQDRMLKELGGMDIILKARQEGISSLVLAMFCIDWLTIENIRCVVISHEDKATQRLFQRARYYIESLTRVFGNDTPYTLKYNSKHEMVNTEKNSIFYIGTAGAKAFGRGDTINNLHVSELSLWPEQERLMIGLLQAVPKDGRIIIESTANGIGDYFYSMWVKAKAGNSPFLTHFLPWFELPSYIMPISQNYPLEYIDEERELINRYHLKPEQIAWRRWKINQMNGDWQDPSTWDKFNQEFPQTAEEAFIVSGNPVFSPRMLKRYLVHCRKPELIGNLIGYNPVTITPNDRGYLKIWKMPSEFHTYAIGVDVSEGKRVNEEAGRESDASNAQVFDKMTYEQVASWYGRIDPDLLGRQLDLLGRFYNDALIGVERNAVGVTPLTTLRDLNYPNLYYRERFGMITEKITGELGWLTDHHSKELLISDAINLLRDSRLQLYEEELVGEMMSFVRDADGRAKASKSAYDDRVMAFLIALHMLSKAKTNTRGNQIEMEDYDPTTQKGFFMEGVSFNSKGWPVKPSEMFDNLDSGDDLNF